MHTFGLRLTFALRPEWGPDFLSNAGIIANCNCTHSAGSGGGAGWQLARSPSEHGAFNRENPAPDEKKADLFSSVPDTNKIVQK